MGVAIGTDSGKEEMHTVFWSGNRRERQIGRGRHTSENSIKMDLILVEMVWGHGWD
jgi:hypothetical protein